MAFRVQVFLGMLFLKILNWTLAIMAALTFGCVCLSYAPEISEFGWPQFLVGSGLVACWVSVS